MVPPDRGIKSGDSFFCLFLFLFLFFVFCFICSQGEILCLLKQKSLRGEL